MGLGAAGCGYEYDNAEYKCPFLGGNLFGFKCLKYHKDLNKHERSGHPLRDNQCSGDASKECESKIAKEKAEETRRVRMQNALQLRNRINTYTPPNLGDRNNKNKISNV